MNFPKKSPNSKKFESFLSIFSKIIIWFSFPFSTARREDIQKSNGMSYQLCGNVRWEHVTHTQFKTHINSKFVHCSWKVTPNKKCIGTTWDNFFWRSSITIWSFCFSNRYLSCSCEKSISASICKRHHHNIRLFNLMGKKITRTSRIKIEKR